MVELVSSNKQRGSSYVHAYTSKTSTELVFVSPSGVGTQLPKKLGIETLMNIGFSRDMAHRVMRAATSLINGD